MNLYPNIIGTYGSLRVGHGNWRGMLRDTECINEQDTLTGYQLFTWPNGGYPCIVKTENPEDTVVVDVFDLNNTTGHDPVQIGDRIDRMEFGAGYHKELVILRSGRMAWVYPMTAEKAERQGMTTYVESGDWTEWKRAQGYSI